MPRTAAERAGAVSHRRSARSYWTPKSRTDAACADRRRPTVRRGRCTSRGVPRAPRVGARRSRASVAASRWRPNQSVTRSGKRICSGPGSLAIQPANASRPALVIANGFLSRAPRGLAFTSLRRSRFCSSRYTWLGVTLQNRESVADTAWRRSQPVFGPSCRNPSSEPWVGVEFDRLRALRHRD